MFVITNRQLDPEKTGLEQFGDTPNSKGPNELRIVEATRDGRGWRIDVLEDECTPPMLRAVGLQKQAQEQSEPIYASQYVSRKILSRVRKEKKNLIFFVHGFNNNMKDVLDRAHLLEKEYNVEVVAFSWPANGGGARGVASYLSDKADANASVGALNRCLAKFHDYLDGFNQSQIQIIYQQAEEKYGDNPERRDQYITEQSEKVCPFTVNMMLHSMGNYLYKKMLGSSAFKGKLLTFDNVMLVAADTNNDGHAQWVQSIRCRKRVYVTINEDDVALMASRIKSGQEQRARLGHYPYELNANGTVYVDFTNASYVKRSHAYFEKGSLRNRTVKRFFDQAINGQRAESGLYYDVSTNMYSVSKPAKISR